MANIGNNEKVSLPSGAELEMTLAPFLEGERLLSAVGECVKDVKVDANTEVDNLASNLNSIKDMFVNCLISQKVKDALLACLKRCSYNGQRITSWDIFDDVKAREDYFSVCWEVCKFNLAPFMKNLISKFSAITKANGTNPQ
jgi:hypothetical protein